ncbi:MAG: hypothetical protein NXI04_21115 [Planctomycetaceae bacterium]|nr:hypothetical protein [Planctomycetaceae bacterium]
MRIARGLQTTSLAYEGYQLGSSGVSAYEAFSREEYGWGLFHVGTGALSAWGLGESVRTFGSSTRAYRNMLSATGNRTLVGLNGKAVRLGNIELYPQGFYSPSLPGVRFAQPSAPRVVDHTAGLQSKPARNSFVWDRFQRWAAGDTEFRVTGGGEAYWADGIDGTALIDAKYAGAGRSYYKPWSSSTEIGRTKMKGIIDQTYDEFRRARDIIADPNTPWTKLQIRTNDFEARTFFEKIMHDLDVPGEVIVYPRW